MALNGALIENYMDEVIRDLLPYAKIATASAMGSADVETFSYAELEFSSRFGNYRNSPYYFQGPCEFIHFTSIQALLSILRQKKIRMYSLSGMADPGEFAWAFKQIEARAADWELDNIKQQVFCLSMCKRSIETSRESRTLWNEYGNGGKGVGVVFHFDTRFKSRWVHLMLSQIHYSEKKLAKVLEAVEKTTKFMQRTGFSIQKYPNLFVKVAAMHKDSSYKDEREVRLLYSKYSGYQEKLETDQRYHVDISHRGKTYFIEEPLEWEGWKNLSDDTFFKVRQYKQIYPFISIPKIIFGPHLTPRTKRDIREAVRELTQDYQVRPEFEDSRLTN